MKLAILRSTLLILLFAASFGATSSAKPCWHRWHGCCNYYHCMPVRYYSCYDGCHRSCYRPCHSYTYCEPRHTCCNESEKGVKDMDRSEDMKEHKEASCCHHHSTCYTPRWHGCYHRCWGEYIYRGGGY